MFHDNDSQLVVNFDNQLVKKELAFMITKTLFIRCYTIRPKFGHFATQYNALYDCLDKSFKFTK